MSKFEIRNKLKFPKFERPKQKFNIMETFPYPFAIQSFLILNIDAFVKSQNPRHSREGGSP